MQSIADIVRELAKGHKEDDVVKAIQEWLATRSQQAMKEVK